MHKNNTQEVQGIEEIGNFQTPKPDIISDNRIKTRES